jgi:hypothetical protein
MPTLSILSHPSFLYTCRSNDVEENLENRTHIPDRLHL